MRRWILQRRQAAKAARRVCRRLRGKKGVWITVRYSPDWSKESTVVSEAIRAERGFQRALHAKNWGLK